MFQLHNQSFLVKKGGPSLGKYKVRQAFIRANIMFMLLSLV